LRLVLDNLFLYIYKLREKLKIEKMEKTRKKTRKKQEKNKKKTREQII